MQLDSLNEKVRRREVVDSMVDSREKVPGGLSKARNRWRRDEDSQGAWGVWRADQI